MVLAARNADQLADQAAALRAAGAIAVHTREFDADDLAAHGPLVASLVAEHGPIGPGWVTPPPRKITDGPA